MKKIIIISILAIIMMIIATCTAVALKPQMHKSFMLEQIIYKRSK